MLKVGEVLWMRKHIKFQRADRAAVRKKDIGVLIDQGAIKLVKREIDPCPRWGASAASFREWIGDNDVVARIGPIPKRCEERSPTWLVWYMKMAASDVQLRPQFLLEPRQIRQQLFVGSADSSCRGSPG